MAENHVLFIRAAGPSGRVQQLISQKYPTIDAARADVRRQGFDPIEIRLATEEERAESAATGAIAPKTLVDLIATLGPDDWTHTGLPLSDAARRAFEMAQSTGPAGLRLLPVLTLDALAGDIILTTAQSIPGRVVGASIGIVTAQCVYGMGPFKDLAAAFRNAFGGRNHKTEEIFADAVVAVQQDLRREAAVLGATAVIAVDLRYQTIGDPGSMMAMVYAAGTAVTASLETAAAGT